VRIYLVHDNNAPWPPRELGYPYVLVSADKIRDPYDFVDFVRRRDWEFPPAWLLVDSGGYRGISRGRLPDPKRVLSVQRVLAEELGAVPVLLDTPVPSPLKAGPGEYRAAARPGSGSASSATTTCTLSTRGTPRASAKP